MTVSTVAPSNGQVVEPEEEKTVLATSGQTFAIFRFTQVDVRNLNTALTINQASDLMDQLVLLSEARKTSSISKANYAEAIDEVRKSLIEQGGIDKRTSNTAKERPLIEPERRFTVTLPTS